MVNRLNQYKEGDDEQARGREKMERIRRRRLTLNRLRQAERAGK